MMQTPSDHATTLGATLPALAFQQWVQVQQMQVQTLLVWQRSWFELQQDLFDRWSCRYAGAARIDD